MIAAARPLVLAWQFLTTVPLNRAHHEPAASELAGSMMWYPLVGALIGGIVFGCDWLLIQWVPREVTSVLVLAVLVAITGGLHQDGLADTFDGLAGGRTPADRLAIMRDPHIGAIGATGLVLSLILRYAALVSLPHTVAMQTVLCMPVIGRWSMVVVAYGAPYARSDGGLGAPFLAHLSLFHLGGATVVAAGLLAWMFGLVPAFVALLLVALLCRILVRYCCRMFGGVTGDTIGATNEVMEILFLVGMPLLSHSI